MRLWRQWLTFSKIEDLRLKGHRQPSQILNLVTFKRTYTSEFYGQGQTVSAGYSKCSVLLLDVLSFLNSSVTTKIATLARKKGIVFLILIFIATQFAKLSHFCCQLCEAGSVSRLLVPALQHDLVKFLGTAVWSWMPLLFLQAIDDVFVFAIPLWKFHIRKLYHRRKSTLCKTNYVLFYQ